MYSLNRATILGNVTRDPEVRQTASGQSVCSFGVATNRSWTDASGKKQEAVEFHNVVAWGKLAEICGQYITKGRKVYIEGRLQTHEWDGQDGAKRQRTEIITENMILLDRAGAAASGAAFKPSPAATAASQVAPPAPPKQDDGSLKQSPMIERAVNPDEEIKIEDIPF